MITEQIKLRKQQIVAKEQAEKQRIAAKKQAEKKADLEKQLTKEFAENKENILSHAQQLLDQSKYSDVVAISNKYAFLHDQGLDGIGRIANSALQEKRRIEKIKNGCKAVALNPPMTPADSADGICLWILNVCLAEPSFIPKEDIIANRNSLMAELKNNSSDEFKKLNLSLPPLELACLNRAYNQVHKRGGEKDTIIVQKNDEGSASDKDYRTNPASLRGICYQSSLSAKKKYPKADLKKVEAFCIVTALDCLRLAEQDNDMHDKMAAMFDGRTIEMDGVEHVVSRKESVNISCGFMGGQRSADLLSKGETKFNE